MGLCTLRRAPALLVSELLFKAILQLGFSPHWSKPTSQGENIDNLKSLNKWGDQWGSNPRPPDSQSSVLTN